VERVVRKISQRIKSAKAWSQDDLIEVRNPIILGWSNYHRHNVSSKVFKKLDSSSGKCSGHGQSEDTGEEENGKLLVNIGNF
jgi:hypothetical protein